MLKIKNMDNFVLSGACVVGGEYMIAALAKSDLKPVAKVTAVIPWCFWTVKQIMETLGSIEGTLNTEYTVKTEET